MLDEEQFKLVQSGSGFESFMKGVEGQDGCSETILQANNGEGISIIKNGYLYIYVSNTNTQYPAYFDDLHIEHTKGSLIEETHYYPFGLTMQGISSRALGAGGNDVSCGCGNKRGFNGNEIQSKEFSDASGLEVYDFNARTYDQQIGRFVQIDPMVLSEEFLQEKEEVNGGAFNLNNLQVYGFAYNNPLRYNDPDGKCPNCGTAAVGAFGGAVFGGLFELGKQLWRDGKVTSWKAVGGAIVQGGVTGAAAGFTGGASLFTTSVVTGAGNVVGGTLNRTIQGQATSIKYVGFDFAVGAAAGAFVNIVSKTNIVAKSLTPQNTGFVAPFSLNKSGQVVFQNGMKNSGAFEFVVKNGKVIIGEGHFYMSNSSKIVNGAGGITLKDGLISSISNSSGHYKPTSGQLDATINMLKELGFKFTKDFQKIIVK